MDQTERRLFLLRSLLKEDPQYRELRIPENPEEQKDLLRALMNVRPARQISREFLAVQDAYLCEERDARGIVDGAALPAVPSDERLVLWQGDITALKADAIVNAANSGMCGCFSPLHNCIDNIIHSRSGIELRLTCADIMRRQGHEEPTGKAKITPAYNLPCRYVLHTVGPIITGKVTEKDRQLLASCYRSCLELAAAYGLESVVFCCISTGVFCFPNEQAARIAVQTVKEFLQTPTSIKRVIFNVFKNLDKEIYAKLLGADGAAEHPADGR